MSKLLVGLTAVAVLAGGVGIGAALPRSTPEECITALDRHAAQYTQLEKAVSAAGDAVEAAYRRSASGLEASTAKLGTIKDKLEAGQGPLQQADDECRGNK